VQFGADITTCRLEEGHFFAVSHNNEVCREVKVSKRGPQRVVGGLGNDLGAAPVK
jgi:hypothetical protein